MMSATTRVTYGSVRLACSSVKRFLTDEGFTLGGFLDCGAAIRVLCLSHGLARLRSRSLWRAGRVTLNTHSDGANVALVYAWRDVWRRPSDRYCDTRGAGVNYASARFVPRHLPVCKRGKLRRSARRRRVRIIPLDTTRSRFAATRRGALLLFDAKRKALPFGSRRNGCAVAERSRLATGLTNAVSSVAV